MKVLKDNLKYIIILIIVSVISMIRFPYYIMAPGGIEDMSKKIIIDGYESKGTFNLAYVTEYDATITTLFISLFNKEWKVINKKDVLLDSETSKNYAIRDKLLMDESISNAIYVAYTKANKNISITSNNITIAHVLKDANTDLRVKDKILKIDDTYIYDKQYITNYLKDLSVGTKINILVENNNKKYKRYAYVMEEKDKKIIGIILTNIREYETSPKVNVKVKKNESGSSGGLITALYIYNSLIKEDITKGYKIVGTGTIELDGTIGEIGGVTYKLKSANKNKANLFLVPNGDNCKEAKKEKKKNNYKIDIKCVSTFDEVIDFLSSYKAKNS